MRVVVIDDDRFYTEAILWRLTAEGHSVIQCMYVWEALDGWFELSPACVENLTNEIPLSVVTGLRSMLESTTYGGECDRMRDADQMCQALRAHLGDISADVADRIVAKARRDPLVPPPDLVVLDLMMPRDRFGKEETDCSRATGLRAMRDILARIPSTRVAVVTVRGEPACHQEVVRVLGPALHCFLTKPVPPTRILQVIDEIAGCGSERRK